MKKIRFICLMLTVILMGVILMACTDGKENENNDNDKDKDGSYTVTVLNYTDWEMKGNADFYDLSGKKVASEPIKSGKASVNLEDGVYIVQIADAPIEVSYNVAVLNAQKKTDTIKINDSVPPNADAAITYYSFDGIVVVLKNGVPQSDLSVEVCYEPEDENEIGYCKMPEITDADGVVAMNNINAGKFHIKVKEQDSEELDLLYEGYGEYSTTKRFIIVTLP